MEHKPLNPLKTTQKPEKEPTLGLDYPCDIDVKAFIQDDLGHEESIKNLVKAHLSEACFCGWSTRKSKGGKYLAISIKVNALDRAHIDALYQILHDHEKVVMVI